MRGFFLVVLVAASMTTAFPAYDSQIAFKTAQRKLASVSSPFDKVGDNVTQWIHNGRDFIHRDGSTCESDSQPRDLFDIRELTCSPVEVVTHPMFNDHRLRIAEPKICDPGVKQYSGYFDITDGKHLFFWQVLLIPRSCRQILFITPMS